jgi:hypothetical protein
MIRRGTFLVVLAQLAKDVISFIFSRTQTWTGAYSRTVITNNSQVCFVDEHPATVDTVNMKTEVYVA